METKAKKRLMNGIMILLILIIIASGVVTVGMIQGWFGSEKESLFVSGKTKGVVNIERNGIGYTLKQDTGMQTGDIVETKKGAEAQLIFAENGAVVQNGNTEIQLTEDEEGTVGIEVKQGELFGDALQYGDPFYVIFDGNSAELSKAVFSVSVQSGSVSLYIYNGDASVFLADGTQERVESGEYLNIVSEKDGTVSYSIEDLNMNSLNEFLIAQCMGCGSAEELCFTPSELQSVLDARAAEKQAALEASLKSEILIEKAAEKESAEEITDTDTAGGSPVSEEVQTETTEQSYVEEYQPQQEETAENVVEDTKICTITILCDTILDNMDNLTDGKEAYVPANGCILDTSSVEFTEGETVFDVLQRVCEYAGIQLEYSWTPMYDSYYIEGINHLYEFDCGNESGWMYKVNGWFPNYGCSGYYLEDGDNIVWCYTCNGLGADVGGSTY